MNLVRAAFRANSALSAFSAAIKSMHSRAAVEVHTSLLVAVNELEGMT